MNNCGWALPTPETKSYSRSTYKRNLPIRRRNTSRKAASHCSNGVAMKAKNEVYCLTPHLFLQSLTAQALFTLKRRRAKTQTTIPCECLLGEGVLCTQAVKRTLIRSVLIQLLCPFADGTRAATAASL